MKKFRPAVPLILAALLAPHAHGQKLRVEEKYDRASDTTELAAHVLYLLNTPEQFVQLQMRGQHSGRQQLLPAYGIRLEIYSFAAKKRFNDPRVTRGLVGVADGRPIKFEWWSYDTAEGDKARQFLPRAAGVGGKPVLEYLSFVAEIEQLAQLAGAREAELRLGPARLALDDTHKAIMREFVARTTPPEGAVPEPDGGAEFVSAELPPALEGAPLDATVKWLLDKIHKHGTSYGPERSRVTKQVESSGCQISYWVTSIWSPNSSWSSALTVTPSGGTQYRVNLGDLSADSVRAVVYKNAAYLHFATRGGEPKIERRFSDEDERTLKSSAIIKLNKSKDLPGIVAALGRAISLCQPAP
jgi:hypothetical protein